MSSISLSLSYLSLESIFSAWKTFPSHLGQVSLSSVSPLMTLVSNTRVGLSATLASLWTEKKESGLAPVFKGFKAKQLTSLLFEDLLHPLQSHNLWPPISFHNILWGNSINYLHHLLYAPTCNRFPYQERHMPKHCPGVSCTKNNYNNYFSMFACVTLFSSL